MKFELVAPFKPAGGQAEAIKKIKEGFNKPTKQTLLGITGSGKTFVMAHTIANLNKPTLVLAHNKTLAAQLYAELKEFFPHNRVEYFVSYYDYYQPESYMPAADVYIEKDSSVNEQIEKMRLKATSSLLSRDDVIVVASISCIYGLGNPQDFRELSIFLKNGDDLSRDRFILQLVGMQYERSDILEPGKFRVRGDVIDVIPSYEENIIRVEFFGSNIERLQELHPITNDIITTLDSLTLFPAKQFVSPEEKTKLAIKTIREELEECAPLLPELERQRLEKRVSYDLEMIEELGYCSGIENYSRHFDGRKKGSRPYVLLDYFPKDFLLIIDESHQSIPQSHGMYKGDFSRKKNLVEFGFRLPCAFDNRPLKFTEFEKFFTNTLFVSATPAKYELEVSSQVVELIIRPTGLVDPLVEVRPIKGQIKDLLLEISATMQRGNRILITTLTKKMAEDLTEYLAKEGVKVRYMHSEINSLDRIEIIRELRSGVFDVLVGINLLREGLDLPEVELVAILDADKEGFLRNETSLIQTIGRAARNENGRVIMYADRMTGSMQEAIKKTKYRRLAQQAYNKRHSITPITIKKSVGKKTRDIKTTKHLSKEDIKRQLIDLDAQMRVAAEQLDFERAIQLRDAIEEMKRA